MLVELFGEYDVVDARIRSGHRVGRNATDIPVSRHGAGDRALPEQVRAKVHRERTGQRAPAEPQNATLPRSVGLRLTAVVRAGPPVN